MNTRLLDIAIWLLMSPILLVRSIFRTFRWLDFWTMAYRHEIQCRNCGGAISLVGIWRCRCGYTYKGHLLRACPICDGNPSMVRCVQCGVTEKLPCD
jgi:hypothetical protein